MWFLFESTISKDDDHQQLTNIVTGCAKSNRAAYGKYDPSTWMFLQVAHDRVKSRYAGERHTSKRSRSTGGQFKDIPHTGMKIPFGVQVNPLTNLRQVYVKRDIPKGFQLWEPLHYHTFSSEHGYVEFLKELPQHLQCDVLEWTHPSYENNDVFVDITLDEGTFIQEATNAEQVNIDIDCVALREIVAGEFVYMNMTEHFAADSSVAWLETIRSDAWRRTGLGMRSRSNIGNGGEEVKHAKDYVVVAPTMAVLSVLFFVLKAFRRGKTMKSSSYNYEYVDYGTSFYSAGKTKIA